jgi:beta-glucanase (GH16 family)
MDIRSLVCSIALAACLAAPAAATERQAPEKPGFDLVAAWDFGAGCDDLGCVLGDFYTRYGYDFGRQDHLPANGEWQRYRLNDNHRIEDGVLKLVARSRDGWRKGGFESGMIRSKHAQKYGYYEARLKLPKGRGLWTTFELLPASATWPPSITVMTAVDNRPEARRTSYHFLSGPATGPAETMRLDEWGGYANGADLGDDFHVFAVEWTEEGVTHFVDGTAVAKRRFDWVGADGADAGPAQVVISLAVGGDWPGPPMEAADFPAALEIDYLRIWRRTPAAPPVLSAFPGPGG